MPETAPPRTPVLMPLLSRGRHRNPSYGACFMEYTALLAGEPFSDRPACVDPKLAAILRGANDLLSDEERPQLVPLLGRAIGLVVPADDGRARAHRFPLRRERRTAEALAQRLHARVSDKLRATVAAPAPKRRARRQARVSETFWDLMSEPARPRTAHEYSTRLIERLEALHQCYEDALAELGVAARPDRELVPAPAATDRLSSRPAA
jgi:hypothetical protein